MRTTLVSIAALTSAFAALTSGLSIGRPRSEACCNALKAILPADTHLPNTTVYNAEYHRFWSATEHLDPACVFQPDTTPKVSRAVALFKRLDCQFATRGGGHSAIPGAANIDGGILIATNRLMAIQINHEQGYVRVGAGNRLGAVYDALDPYNLTPVIGRFETVGLGLALAAGMSFLSNREGMTIDNVVNYEVVIANGTIINANRRNHPDLFWALKGGGNNFGVVTHFDLRTFPTNGTIYGGVVYHPESSFDRVSDVIYDYHTHQAVDDLLTHAMPEYAYVGATDVARATTLLAYNAPVEEFPPIMQPWVQVPYESHTLSRRTYGNLSHELGDGVLDNLSVDHRIFSFYADRQFYRDVWRLHLAWLRERRDVPGLVGVHVIMPITPNQVRQGIAKGGNALGLDSLANGNRTLGILFMLLSFQNIADAPRLRAEHEAFMRSLEDLARSRGLWHPYIMLSYSGAGQDPIAAYGPANVARLRRISRAYDPTSVFQRLVPGGQKLPPA